MDGSEIDHGFTALGQFFVVFAQAAIATKPCKGAFDDPAARQELKARLLRIAFDDLQDGIQMLFDPVDQGAGIATIGPEFAQASLVACDSLAKTSLAPSRSWMLAAWTTTSMR